MKLLGLTGGIAMGKSTVAQMLFDRGCAVVDTDALARQVVEPGMPALAEIVQAFGPQLRDSAGRLRRAELARLVFSDAAARRRLEGILHPRIQELWRRQVQEWRSSGRLAAVVVIPLLFETEAAGEFEAIVCAACTSSSQQRRFAARGWTLPEAEARLRAQWPIGEKMARSDFVIWTEGSEAIARAQVDRVLRQLSLHSLLPSDTISDEQWLP